VSNVDVIRVCSSSPSVVFNKGAACVPHQHSKRAPVDDYYMASGAITLAGTPDLLSADAALGRLLLLGHVSAAEAYVRAILVGLLGLCPLSRNHAGSQVLPFSSISYYDFDEIAYGLFDGVSLAGAAEVKNKIKKFLDLDIASNSALSSVLRSFDEICHLRHAAVHAHGSIGSGNAAALGIPGTGRRLALNIDLPRLHESALICRSFVQELNQFLFISTFIRWKKAGLLAQDYSVDRVLFRKLYKLFRSQIDPGLENISPKMAYDKLIR
jgi:hypothetical protein